MEDVGRDEKAVEEGTALVQPALKDFTVWDLL